MPEILVTDPAQLAELQSELANIMSMFSNASERFSNRPTRGKYLQAANELKNNELPFIVLSRDKFNNESEASMNSQFKKVAEKNKLGFIPSLVSLDDTLLLCNFDAEDAERKFNDYVMSRAGISARDLADATRELDAATR